MCRGCVGISFIRVLEAAGNFSCLVFVSGQLAMVSCWVQGAVRAMDKVAGGGQGVGEVQILYRCIVFLERLVGLRGRRAGVGVGRLVARLGRDQEE